MDGTPIHRTSGLCPVVMACDENYAMPLAVALRSLVESNERHWPIDVTVLTDGFTRQAEERVLRSLPPGAARVRWVLIDLKDYAAFTPMSYLSRMTYARFQIERHFAEHVERILYVDVDTLILEDLAPLVHLDLAGRVVAAVPDHHIDGALQRGEVPDPGGLPDVKRYFNAGVLLIDLPRWRAGGLSAKALAYLERFPQTPYADQDALNVVCEDTWAELPTHWNHQDHLRMRVRDLAPGIRPAIVHFITAAKPWKPQSLSVNAGLHAAYRDKTAFRPSFGERLVWHATWVGVRLRNKMQRLAYRLGGASR